MKSVAVISFFATPGTPVSGSGPMRFSQEAIMSEHVWIHDNLAAYIADGLDAGERERVEQHLAECADCFRAVAEVQALDRKLGQLFAPVHPGPDLEDAAIQRLRQRRPRRLRLGRGLWVVGTAAAVAFVGLIG